MIRSGSSLYSCIPHYSCNLPLLSAVFRGRSLRCATNIPNALQVAHGGPSIALEHVMASALGTGEGYGYKKVVPSGNSTLCSGKSQVLIGKSIAQ